MTCIVGIEHSGIVTIGADSAGSDGSIVVRRSDQKVFTNGPFIFGFTDSFRMGQLLRYSLTLPDADSFYPVGDEIDEYMATTFVNAVRKTLKKGGYARRKDEEEEAGQFLVGVRDRLYDIGEDYSVGRNSSGYNAVGIGYQVALGVLFALKGWDPYFQLETALTAASEHCLGVSEPFIWVETSP